MPDITGLIACCVEDDAPGRYRCVGVIEKVEADTNSVPAEYRKVDAITPCVRPKRERHARTHRLNLTQAEQMF
jgi:hypothetical protein